MTYTELKQCLKLCKGRYEEVFGEEPPCIDVCFTRNYLDLVENAILTGVPITPPEREDCSNG